jgi:hypothetical protein
MTKIGDEVKRETKVEEHHRKIREEINRKVVSFCWTWAILRKALGTFLYFEIWIFRR